MSVKYMFQTVHCWDHHRALTFVLGLMTLTLFKVTWTLEKLQVVFSKYMYIVVGSSPNSVWSLRISNKIPLSKLFMTFTCIQGMEWYISGLFKKNGLSFFSETVGVRFSDMRSDKFHWDFHFPTSFDDFGQFLCNSDRFIKMKTIDVCSWQVSILTEFEPSYKMYDFYISWRNHRQKECLE